MNRRNLQSSLGIALASALLMTACAGPVGVVTSYDDDAAITISDGGADETEDQSQRESELANRRPQTPISLTLPGAEVDEGRPVWELGPLDEFLIGVGRRTNPASEAQVITDMQTNWLLIEGYIAQCMLEQGFEYIPGLWSINFEYNDWSALPAPWDSRELAEMYGFQIVTDVLGRYSRRIIRDSAPDPNDAIRARMSPTERQAYDDALFGIMDCTGIPEGQPCDMVQPGCRTQAWAYIYVWAPDGFESLNDEVSNWWLTIGSHPRIQELNTGWAACMVNSGFPEFSDPREVAWELRQEWWDIDTVDHWSGMATREQIEAFTAREIAVALADWDCRDLLNYDDERQVIEFDIQQEFLDRHQAEFDAWALQFAEREVSR